MSATARHASTSPRRRYRVPVPAWRHRRPSFDDIDHRLGLVIALCVGACIGIVIGAVIT